MDQRQREPRGIGEFRFKRLLLDLAARTGRELLRLVMATALGVALGAAVCLYYGIPFVFSLIGGVLVLGVAAALALGP